MLARSLSRPRRQNSGRADEVRRVEPFLKWIRGRSCLIDGRQGHVCRGYVRACHVDYAGGKGVGIKVHDRHAVPMCDGAHTEQTDVLGWGPFEAKYGIRAVDEAAALFDHWLNRTPMGAKWKASRDA